MALSVFLCFVEDLVQDRRGQNKFVLPSSVAVCRHGAFVVLVDLRLMLLSRLWRLSRRGRFQCCLRTDRSLQRVVNIRHERNRSVLEKFLKTALCIRDTSWRMSRIIETKCKYLP